LADTISKEQRSANMSRIRGKNTQPELAVRRMARELGHPGYRLHRKNLPGRPDLVWVGRGIALFVHGCFWHGHHCVHGSRRPKSNQGYWLPKIEQNQARDLRNIRKLRRWGWRVMTVWECELRKPEVLRRRLTRFLARD